MSPTQNTQKPIVAACQVVGLRITMRRDVMPLMEKSHDHHQSHNINESTQLRAVIKAPHMQMIEIIAAIVPAARG